MNNKGFTLVELLAVIVVIGIVASIGVVSVNGINNAIKSDLLTKKINTIEEAAILYGEDYRGSIINSGSHYNTNYTCINITVRELVNSKYLDSDCDGSVCVLDPGNKNNNLTNKNVILYYKNKRIHAKVDVATKCS